MVKINIFDVNQNTPSDCKSQISDVEFENYPPEYGVRDSLVSLPQNNGFMENDVFRMDFMPRQFPPGALGSVP